MAILSKNPHNYDVLVIGAGPAGLMAGWKAACKGCSVLVLEKEGHLGAKPCAETIAESDFLAAEIPVSPQFLDNNVDGADIYSAGDDNPMRITGKGYVLNKPLFLHALASRAVSHGAELFMQAEVLEIMLENGRAIGVKYVQEGEVLQASLKILIGADGTGSITSRNCGFDRGRYEAFPAVQYVMANCSIPEKGIIRLYFGNDVAPKGYAWVFPKNESMANVGVGMQGANIRLYLDKFIRNHPALFQNASAVKEGVGLVPVGGQVQAIMGNIMLCGDSAGQVVPVTGAGIGTSIIAGSIAGETAALALQAGNISLLKDYPKSYAHSESRIHGNFNMLDGLLSF